MFRAFVFDWSGTLANDLPPVLECTNLPPYAAAIRRATGRPVHDLVGFVGERWGRR